MPAHDWSRVDAGTFHHFHHSFIEETHRTLNDGLLPEDYYAMSEQRAGFIPDVLTLHNDNDSIDISPSAPGSSPAVGAVVLEKPKDREAGRVSWGSYSTKQKQVVIHHISDHQIIAVIEIVSPGNKASRYAIETFIEKTEALLRQNIHLLLVDLHPPGPRDPHGLHGLIWEDIYGVQYDQSHLLQQQPLTLAAYEACHGARAFVEHIAVGEALREMPLFLKPGAHVPVPLETIYQQAFRVLPKHIRQALQDTR